MIVNIKIQPTWAVKGHTCTKRVQQIHVIGWIVWCR